VKDRLARIWLLVLRVPFAAWAAIWAIFLTVVLTWPGILTIDELVLGSRHGDGMKHVWTLWWIRAELLQEHSIPLHTELLNFPAGMDLYPIEPLNGLFVSLIGWVDIVMATNITTLLNLTLTGFFGALFGRRLSGTRWGGMAGGTVLQGSAFAQFAIHVGVGELQHLWMLPLGMWMWLRLRDNFAWRDAVILGATLAAATLSCFYIGFFLALSVAVMSLVTIWAGRNTPKLLGGYVVAAGLGLMIIIPITRTFAESYKAGTTPDVSFESWVLEEHGQPTTDPPHSRLELHQLVVSRRADRSNTNPQFVGYGGGRYVGLAALLLLLGAVIVRPRKALPWLLVAATGVLFASGSFAVEDGADITNDDGLRIRMPFFYLNRVLGFVGEPINFPIRFLAMSILGLSAGAAIITSRMSRFRWIVWVVAVLSVVDVGYNQLNPRPMATFALDPFPELAELPDGGPMIDAALQFRSDKHTRRASLSAQINHGQRIAGVPLERIDYFARDGHHFTMATPLMQALKEGYQNDAYPDFGGGVEPHEDLAILHDAGFRRILVLGHGADQRLPQKMCEALTELIGEPSFANRRVQIYDIPDPELSDLELEELRAKHNPRVVRMQRLDMRPGPMIAPTPQPSGGD